MNDATSNHSRVCGQCGRSLVPLSVPYTKRRCDECGETVHVVERGEEGRGIRIREGDQFVIPAGFIRMSLDPQQATVGFFRPGINWFVKMLYFEGIPSTAEGLDSLLQQYEEQANKVIEGSSLLEGLDRDDPDDAEKILELVQERNDWPEWWATIIGSSVQLVRECIEAGDAREAARAMGILTNARAMLIFLENLEETVWRGYTLGGLRRVLDIWEVNKSNADEEFWQTTLTQNSIVLSQVFSFPVIILQGKAYLGGTGLDQSGGNLVDFLLANDLTENTALVERKTPKTKLLGRKYRSSAYSPSSELVGAVAQISNYKHSLIKNSTQPETGVNAFDPPCLVVAGSLDQIPGAAQRRSFELYRQGLRDVQVVTYDELFRKVANPVCKFLPKD